MNDFWNQFWPQFFGGVASGIVLAIITFVATYLARLRIARFMIRVYDNMKSTLSFTDEQRQ